MSPRVVLVIQARMGSVRLPGKSMMPLAGFPLMGRILERVKRCETPDEIVLAIPDIAQDDPLEQLARDMGVSCFRGNEGDLVDRYYQAGLHFRADVVLRLPGDNVCPEPSEIDRMVRQHRERRPPFSSNLTNLFGNGYPDGIGIECIEMPALKAVWETETDPFRREHVATNFVDYANGRAVDPDRFPVETVMAPEDIRRPDICLDVNTLAHYELMNELYCALYPTNPTFTIRDVIPWWDRRKPVRQD